MAHPHEEHANTTTPGFHVREVTVYRGPHLYSRTPMVRLEVDLGILEQYPTDKLPGFSSSLLEVLPGLNQHGCCYGRPGGFVSRLQEGTWLGHVCEHVAIELQNIIGAEVSRGKTRSVRGVPGVYNVMYEYETEAVGLLAGRFAIELVSELLPFELRGLRGLGLISASGCDSFNLEEALERLTTLHRKTMLGPTTSSLVREAKKRNIPYRRLDGGSLIQFGYGKYIKRIRASCTSITSEIATEIAGDKQLTNTLLRDAGLPVPFGAAVFDLQGALAAASKLGFPVVIKPAEITGGA